MPYHPENTSREARQRLADETIRNDREHGRRVCLAGMDLNGLDFRLMILGGADMRHANLYGVCMDHADLRGADLTDATLRDADLSHADLDGARLVNADLRGAKLQGATLNGADLAGADLDYSSWPLWCGSLGAKLDKRLACQLLYHCVKAMMSVDDDEARKVCDNPDVLALANMFARADECGRLGESGIPRMAVESIGQQDR